MSILCNGHKITCNCESPISVINPSCNAVYVDSLPDEGMFGIFYVTGSPNSAEVFVWNGSSFEKISDGTTLGTLSVTENGSYEAPDGVSYSAVEVDVHGDGIEVGEPVTLTVENQSSQGFFLAVPFVNDEKGVLPIYYHWFDANSAKNIDVYAYNGERAVYFSQHGSPPHFPYLFGQVNCMYDPDHGKCTIDDPLPYPEQPVEIHIGY